MRLEQPRSAAMLNFNHLYYFHVAATEGSLAATASRLGVTQPTVSEQIRALERALGGALFDRTPSGLRLTDAGRVAFSHTSIMFGEAARLLEALGRTGRDLPVTLRVGQAAAVARSVSADFLLPLFALEESIPSIRTGEGLELVRDLRAADLDLVLIDRPPPESAMGGLQVAELGGSVLVAVAPQGVEPTDSWDNIGLVQYRSASTARWLVDQYLDEHGLRPRIAGEADDPLLLVETAARGGFVTFVPRSVARDAVAAGRLRVLSAVDPARVTVYALYHDVAISSLARRAVEALVEHFKQQHE
jgi:LysR family transcriptional activator of nhaA